MSETNDKTFVRTDIFKDVQFSLCDDLPQFEEVKKVLLECGGKFVHYLSDNVTHLIADNWNHPSVSVAIEIYEKPVVTSRWVWLCLKSSILLPTAGFSPFCHQLFSNVCVCPSNITGSDVMSLWAMVTYYGGSFQLELDSHCTHLISTRPEGAKYERALETFDSIKIVTPDWIIDSVKSKTLCDEDLYHPRLLIFNVPSNKIEVSSVTTNLSSASSSPSSSIVVSAPLQMTGSNIGQHQQVTLKTVSLPSTTMITTLAISQPYNTHPGVPNAPQGGRVRVYLPPQHQVRLMQMQTQIRQPRPQQVLNVQQVIQRQSLPQQQQQQTLVQQQTNANANGQANAQWSNPPNFTAATQSGQLYQGTSEFGKIRAVAGPNVQQQPQTVSQPRQVYLAVQQQQQIRQQQLVQLKQQQFISVQSQPQSQQSQPRTPSNIVIQQRPQLPININGPQQMRLQNQTQQLIQLQQRQPVALQQQQGHSNFVRGPQQIIIQQQNPHALPRHLQLNNQGIQSQSPFAVQNQHPVPIGHSQVQQRMITPPRVPQFPQQTQLQRNQIRVSPAQQVVSTTMPTGQPRVFMKSPPQYPIQQFDPTIQSLRPQYQQQQPMQFMRAPQWAQSSDSPQGQQLQSVRPQHILLTAQPQQQQPSQQQIIQWQQQQQQDIQRRQIMQQQQTQQRFSLPNQQEKVRPSVSIVNVSTAAAAAVNAESPQTGPAPSLRNAQTPAPSSTVNHAPHVNVVSTPNTTPNASIASPVVTPKTKTALANLLNNRLQSGNVGTNKGDGGNSNDGSSPNASGSLTLSSSSVSNKTGFIGSPGVLLPSGEIVQSLRQDEGPQTQNLVPQLRFYGYDTRIQIPSDLFLLGSVFYIDYDNCVESSQITKWKNVIMKFGGEIEESYAMRCTHVLCENQQSQIVQQALRENKRCITVYWLNDVIETHKMLPPSKALHLPCAFNEETKPCKNHIISASNFENDERQRIKDMIQRTGAKYTSYMSQKNTVLICKKIDGKKYRKAMQWRLPIVNVQWINEIIFGHFDVLQFSNLSKKYQVFDTKDPFKIDYTAIPNLMNAWRTPIRVADDVIKAKVEKRAEIEKHKELENSITVPMETDFKHENNSIDLENGPTPSKIIKLNDKSLIKSNVFPMPLSPSSGTLNSISSLSLNPEYTRLIKVMFTGSVNKNHLKSIVINLGGRIAHSPAECTHLVTNRIARTVKFMCAFSSCKFILTSDWVLECGSQGKFVDEYDYVLNDPEGERTFQFSLVKSLHSRNAELFKGIVFYLTNGLTPSPSVLKDIVESASGIAVLKKRPTKRQLNMMRKTGYQFIVVTCENDLHLCDFFFENDVDVVNAEFVLTGILKQEININEYAFKSKCINGKL